MRSLAELFFKEGFTVLAMRMPGHGTVPAGLLSATWEDWAAAVRIGARHVQDQIDASVPFFLCGYSNGGALAVDYCLNAIEEKESRIPDRLFLLSPALLCVTSYGTFVRGTPPIYTIGWSVSRRRCR